MKKLFYLFILISLSAVVHAQSGRSVLDFNQNWTFNLGDVPNGQNVDFNDASWRKLNLPHDWSIEGEFKKENPATVEGGALPAGLPAVQLSPDSFLFQEALMPPCYDSSGFDPSVLCK